MSDCTLQFSQPLKNVVLATTEESQAFSAQDLEAAKKEAYQRGFHDASGLLEQQVIDQRHEMMHLKQETFRSLENQHQSLIEQLKQAVPELVMEALRRIFTGLEIDRDMVLRIVGETLRDISPGRQTLEVTLSPHDLELIRDHENDFREKYPAIEFRADSELRPGDCKVRTRFGVIDARIATKLKSVESFLR